MSWVVLALLSALALATVDVVTKARMVSWSAERITFARFFWTGILLSPLWLIVNVPALPPRFWGLVALTIPLEVLAVIWSMRAIKLSPLSQAQPLLALTPAFTALIGYLLLGERLTLLGVCGIILVVIGAYLLRWGGLLAAGPARSQSMIAPFVALIREPGPRYMLGVAAIYAVTTVFCKAALAYVPAMTFVVIYYTAMCLVTTLWFVWRESDAVHALFEKPGAHFAVAILMAVMIISHFLAMAQIEAAYMITVKRTSLLFSIFYGVLLFREGGLIRKLSAGMVMLLGVYLVSSRLA